MIGFARDDPERLRRVAGNLEIASAAATARLARKPQQGTLDESA
jgi:hypothetical protein